MHLTRMGFNLLVVVYLAPMALIDFIGNSTVEGAMSDYYYYKFILDSLLVAYAIYQAFFSGTTSHIDTAKARVSDHADEVVSFEKIGSIEYIYCALLSIYAAANWYFMHDINKNSTGLLSMATLIWSFLSIAIVIISVIQFYHLKSGKIVELKKRVMQ